MAGEAVVLLTALSSITAATAMILSIIVLRSLLSLRKQTELSGRLLQFQSLESTRRRLLGSSRLSERSLKELSVETRQLGAEVSKIFAAVAGLLNETHRLEGNPHPRIDSEKLRQINESLLSIGESSLSATRIAEKISEDFADLDSGLRALRRNMEPQSDAS